MKKLIFLSFLAIAGAAAFLQVTSVSETDSVNKDVGVSALAKTNAQYENNEFTEYTLHADISTAVVVENPDLKHSETVEAVNAGYTPSIAAKARSPGVMV